jgi:hypothetical protein
MKNKNKNRDLQKRKKHWEGQRRCHEMQNKTQIGAKKKPRTIIVKGQLSFPILPKEFQKTNPKEPCSLGLA